MITCKPDIVEVKRSPDDEFIILGCDGIWERYVENSQGLLDMIKESLASAGKESNGNRTQLKIVIERLLDTLLAKDTREGIGCDNMSAILVMLK